MNNSSVCATCANGFEMLRDTHSQLVHPTPSLTISYLTTVLPQLNLIDRCVRRRDDVNRLRSHGMTGDTSARRAPMECDQASHVHVFCCSLTNSRPLYGSTSLACPSHLSRKRRPKTCPRLWRNRAQAQNSTRHRSNWRYGLRRRTRRGCQDDWGCLAVIGAGNTMRDAVLRNRLGQHRDNGPHVGDASAVNMSAPEDSAKLSRKTNFIDCIAALNQHISWAVDG